MSHRSLRLGALALALVFAFAPAAARADDIVDWNNLLLDSIRAARTNPPVASRQMAILHTSQYDALVGLVGGFEPYHVGRSGPDGASPDAAVAAAGHRALTALYPSRAAIFDEHFAADLAAIPDGQAKDDGVVWGNEVADAILALRANDGSTTVVAYTPPVGATWWTNTPPAFAPPLLPNWPLVTPWTMSSGSQFRAGGQPVTPNDPAYFLSWIEVFLYGENDSVVRDADQTQIALFWNDGAGTQTPPGHWFTIAQVVSGQEGLTLLENARLFALLGLAVADAAIVSWDNKYFYNNWRPVTGIQHADTDGNPGTFSDPGWLSLIGTPPFPSYTSGHSTFSGASSRVLAQFFGTDDVAFSVGSDGLPGVTRSFTSFSQAAEEAGQSRIYGGIHWQYDNRDALASGRALGTEVFHNFLRPDGATTSCVDGLYTLCLLDRFSVEASFRSSATAPAERAVAIANGGTEARFWFFDEDNLELTVKVLNACTFNDRYWVFASGLTNVEVQITVTDSHAGSTRTYFNPLNRAFTAVTDTDAFATCP